MSLFGKERKNRREILRAITRAVALGGLALLGGMAMSRDKGETCRQPDFCQGCRIFERCTLPQALSAKQTGKEPNHG